MASLRFVKWVGNVCVCDVRARVVEGGDIIHGLGLSWEFQWVLWFYGIMPWDRVTWSNHGSI